MSLDIAILNRYAKLGGALDEIARIVVPTGKFTTEWNDIGGLPDGEQERALGALVAKIRQDYG